MNTCIHVNMMGFFICLTTKPTKDSTVVLSTKAKKEGCVMQQNASSLKLSKCLNPQMCNFLLSCENEKQVILFGLELEALTERQEAELQVTEMKMSRFSLEASRVDRVKNEYIRGTAHIWCCGGKATNAPLRWVGHVQRGTVEECWGWAGVHVWVQRKRTWVQEKQGQGILLDGRDRFAVLIPEGNGRW